MLDEARESQKGNRENLFLINRLPQIVQQSDMHLNKISENAKKINRSDFDMLYQKSTLRRAATMSVPKSGARRKTIFELRRDMRKLKTASSSTLPQFTFGQGA